MPKAAVSWTPERVETLLRLRYVEKKKTREIVQDMRLPSRNVVIGKLSRLEHDGTAHRFRQTHPAEPEPAEPSPEPMPAPVIPTSPAGKDPRLCVHPGCTRTKMAQNLHLLCQIHDQERINAKSSAA